MKLTISIIICTWLFLLIVSLFSMVDKEHIEYKFREYVTQGTYSTDGSWLGILLIMFLMVCIFLALTTKR